MTEASTVRLVVQGLILTAVVSIVGAVVLEVANHDAGPAWTIATASLTALGALLANTRTATDPAVHQALAAAEDAGAAKTKAAGLEELIKTEAAKPPRARKTP